MDTDVLIVGAGPTGLMLANQLVRRGVRVEIIDRHTGPAQQSRALGVQARTLEIYAQLGIVERALELGKRGTGATLWAQGRRMAHVPLGDAGRAVTPYPFILVLGQDDNELIMGEKLNALVSRVQWNTELVDFTQHANHVSATLSCPMAAIAPSPPPISLAATARTARCASFRTSTSPARLMSTYFSSPMSR